LAKVFLNEGVGVILGTLTAIALVAVVFKVNEAVLPVLLLLTLSLGSSYHPEIAERSFYLRFFLLALVAFRGVLLFLGTRGSVEGGRHGTTAVHLLFLCVGLLGLAGSAVSVAPGVSLQRSLSFLLLFFVIFVYFWIRFQDAERCMEYGVALWRSVAIVFGAGLILLVVRNSEMFVAGRLRLLLGNPNQLGHYCAIMAPLAVWYAMERAVGRARTLAWFVVGTLSLSIVFSGSRGGMIACFMGLGLQFLVCYRRRALFLLLAGALVFSVHLLRRDPMPRGGEDPSFFQETVVREETLKSGSGRTGVWKSARRLIEKKPLFGYGFGATDQLFFKGYFPDLPLTFQGGHVHNSYLEELLNLGWIGAGPLFLAILLFLLAGLRLWTKPFASTPNFRFTSALASMTLAGSISGIFESWFTSVGSVFCFPFWFAGALLLKMTTRFNDWKEA
jgi:O-antigen ligase